MNNKGKFVSCIVVACISIILVFCIVFGLKQGRIKKYQVSYFDLFDTVSVIEGYDKNKGVFEEKASFLYEKLDTYNKLFDIYNEYEGINNLYTVNSNAGIQPVKVDESIIELLKISLRMYEESDGKVNVLLGPVLSLWHEAREKAATEEFSHLSIEEQRKILPDKGLLKERNLLTNIEDIEIDEEASTVFLKKKGMSIDVGSIAKGYAARKVAEYAVANGMDSLMINLGGNVVTIGTKTDGTMWQVGICDPCEDGILEVVPAKDISIVTSGDYQRYFEIDGERFCHIIDSKTLIPANYFKQVTVIYKDSDIADALSTALFTMSYKDGVKLLSKYEKIRVIWVTKDGEVLEKNN